MIFKLLRYIVRVPDIFIGIVIRFRNSWRPNAWIIANNFAFFICTKFRRRISKTSISVLHVSHFAHKPYILSRKLRKTDIKADYLALNRDWTYLHMGKKAYDYSMESMEKGYYKYSFNQFYYMWKIMPKYDIIHVHCQSFFTSGMQEYIYLKRLGKKFIFHFRGCDIRRKSESDKFFPDLNCCQECSYPNGSCDNEQQKKYIETLKQLGDALFCTTPDLLPFCPHGTIYLPFTPPPEDFIAKIRPADRNKNIFRIVTSSNHDGIDGTQYLRNAVNKLRGLGCRVELIEVKKQAYPEALSIYASADVYAGKLRMGFYNNANIECMMLGIPCMSFIRPEFREKYCPDCPIIQVTPQTIYDVLREYVSKPEDLKKIGAEGPSFVEKYHCEKKSILPIVETYRKILE